MPEPLGYRAPADGERRPSPAPLPSWARVAIAVLATLAVLAAAFLMSLAARYSRTE